MYGVPWASVAKSIRGGAEVSGADEASGTQGLCWSTLVPVIIRRSSGPPSAGTSGSAVGSWAWPRPMYMFTGAFTPGISEANADPRSTLPVKPSGLWMQLGSVDPFMHHLLPLASALQ